MTAAKLKERFLQFYAKEHQLDPTELDIVADHVVAKDGRSLGTVADAGMGLVFNATDTFTQRQTRPLEDTQSPDPQHVAMNFSASRCVVDVDPELGLVKVVQIDVVQDAGKVVNPPQARGQIEGGVIMGMGLAVTERLQAVGGKMVNADWEGYFVPTTIDVPVVNVDFIEHPEPGIPYGMRGIAELPHVQSPPVVAEAVRNATGAALPGIPVTPDVVCGLADAVRPDRFESTERTVGPWQAPVTRRDVGPWRASVPERE